MRPIGLALLLSAAIILGSGATLGVEYLIGTIGPYRQEVLDTCVGGNRTAALDQLNNFLQGGWQIERADIVSNSNGACTTYILRKHSAQTVSTLRSSDAPR